MAGPADRPERLPRRQVICGGKSKRFFRNQSILELENLRTRREQLRNKRHRPEDTIVQRHSFHAFQ